MTTDEQLGRMEPATEEKYQTLKAEIAKRVRHVCGKMPDGEFDELVDKMARLELRYRGREGR
jgi:hypothetical protein